MELKKPDGKPTTEQQQWHVALNKAGGEAYIFWPSDMDKILEILK